MPETTILTTFALDARLPFQQRNEFRFTEMLSGVSILSCRHSASCSLQTPQIRAVSHDGLTIITICQPILHDVPRGRDVTTPLACWLDGEPALAELLHETGSSRNQGDIQ